MAAINLRNRYMALFYAAETRLSGRRCAAGHDAQRLSQSPRGRLHFWTIQRAIDLARESALPGFHPGIKGKRTTLARAPERLSAVQQPARENIKVAYIRPEADQ